MEKTFRSFEGATKSEILCARPSLCATIKLRNKSKFNKTKIIKLKNSCGERIMQFYNDLTRKNEEFVPITKGHVGLYSCGPTVYNYAHIGNHRSYVFVDLLKRFLLYSGYSVKHVMNLTDVDDKTIKGSKAEGIPLKEFTERYTKFFAEDLRALNILLPDVMPKATEHIPEMTGIIKRLYENGYAYKAEDGSTYFSIAKFKDYGKLSGINKAELKAGARVNNDEYTKDNAQDFALWKAWTPEDGNVFWETEYGKGRPGWHIECSAMSSKYLGETFDIHTGGIDLIFPHHENEIAQSECANSKKFVNYWLHCEYLVVDGKKMSKSLGNFYTLRDILAKGYKPMAIRYLLLSTHYRGQLNFTLSSLDAAADSVEKLRNLAELLKETSEKNISAETCAGIIEKSKEEFDSALSNDLNVSGAIAAIFSFAKEMNKRIAENTLSSADSKLALSVLAGFDSVLGVIGEVKEETLAPELMALINEREEARKKKDYSRSDAIRKELAERGIIVLDGKDGVKWKRA
jgi:cysteinyl-tRNA synthetase